VDKEEVGLDDWLSCEIDDGSGASALDALDAWTSLPMLLLFAHHDHASCCLLVFTAKLCARGQEDLVRWRKEQAGLTTVRKI
jgi:hypothetical protein